MSEESKRNIFKEAVLDASRFLFFDWPPKKEEESTECSIEEEINTSNTTASKNDSEEYRVADDIDLLAIWLEAHMLSGEKIDNEAGTVEYFMDIVRSNGIEVRIPQDVNIALKKSP